MATMKDVAKAAGVSVATVSRVIAGTASVSPETRKKVMDTIEELQYCSNSLAKGLRKQQTNFVAVLIRDISQPLYADMLRGIEDVLNTNGYIPLFFNSDNDTFCQDEAFQQVLSLGIEGAVIAPCREYAGLLQKSALQDFPSVFITEEKSQGKKGNVAGRVCCDYYKAGVLAADAFARAGAKRCIYIPDKNAPALRQDLLYNGFSERCHALGIMSSVRENVDEREAEAIKKGRDVPGCLLRSSFYAVELINLFRRKGIRIPEDVKLICLENTIYAKMSTPAVTVLAPNGYQIGMVSAQYLMEKIQGIDRKEPVILEPKLIKRGSL